MINNNDNNSYFIFNILIVMDKNKINKMENLVQNVTTYKIKVEEIELIKSFSGPFPLKWIFGKVLQKCFFCRNMNK